MFKLKIYWLLLLDLLAVFAGFIGCIRWIYWLLLAGLLSLNLLAAFAGPSLTVFAAANKLRFLVLSGLLVEADRFLIQIPAHINV